MSCTKAVPVITMEKLCEPKLRCSVCDRAREARGLSGDRQDGTARWARTRSPSAMTLPRRPINRILRALPPGRGQQAGVIWRSLMAWTAPSRTVRE